jgi:hypothetical protein
LKKFYPIAREIAESSLEKISNSIEVNPDDKRKFKEILDLMSNYFDG